MPRGCGSVPPQTQPAAGGGHRRRAAGSRRAVGALRRVSEVQVVLPRRQWRRTGSRLPRSVETAEPRSDPESTRVAAAAATLNDRQRARVEQAALGGLPAIRVARAAARKVRSPLAVLTLIPLTPRAARRLCPYPCLRNGVLFPRAVAAARR